MTTAPTIPRSMRAIVYGGRPGVVSVAEREVRPPSGRQILCRVLRAGICASDVHLVHTGCNAADGPAPFGHEYVGEVVAVGPAVRGVTVGDRLASMAFAACDECDQCRRGEASLCATRRVFRNAFGEYAVTEEQASTRIPAAVADEIAVLTEPVAVAQHALRRAGAIERDVVVLGAGPIGLLVALLARRAGAGRVLLTARTDRRTEQVAAVGADALLTGPGAVDGAIEALGRRPGLVFDCAGAPGTLGDAVRLAGPGARVVLVGVSRQDQPLATYAALRHELDLRFSLAYSAGDLSDAVPVLLDAPDALRSLVTRTVGLTDFADTFAAVAAGADACKVLLDPWS
jgi:(R,R)-butanediol dehydrogenase/meso-butanediol dehydrogenase/diacetyl reductase